MLDYLIITNNPLVCDKYGEKVLFIDAGVENVLIAVRDKVHSGNRLLNHPLSGGVLPGVCPYKSLIISSDSGDGPPETDFESLGLIENALRVMKKTPDGFAGYDNKVLEDFQVLDLDILDSALR